MHGSMPRPKRNKKVPLGKRLAKSGVVQWLLPRLVGLYIRFVRATSRMEEDGPGLALLLDAWKNQKPLVVCFWHGRLLLMARVRWRRLRGFHVLISTHRDGEVIARSIENLGMSTVRGSTKRGGVAAMRELLDVVAAKGIAVFTPDGPSGPRMRAQGGAVAAASATGVPIVPITCSTRRGPFLKSWDRFLLSTPFNHGLYLVGEPMVVPPDLDEAGFEAWRLRLETTLNDLTAEADRRMGRTPIEPEEPGRGRRR